MLYSATGLAAKKIGCGESLSPVLCPTPDRPWHAVSGMAYGTVVEGSRQTSNHSLDAATMQILPGYLSKTAFAHNVR